MNESCCTRLSDVLSSPEASYGKVLTVRGRITYNGYIFLADAAVTSGVVQADAFIEVPIEELVGRNQADDFFELDGT